MGNKDKTRFSIQTGNDDNDERPEIWFSYLLILKSKKMQDLISANMLQDPISFLSWYVTSFRVGIICVFGLTL